MNVSFRKSFQRDLKAIKDQALRDRIGEVIEAVERSATLQQIGHLKKIEGTDDCYRLRVGDYRLGLVIEGDSVEFVRCLHRRDLYRRFP